MTGGWPTRDSHQRAERAGRLALGIALALAVALAACGTAASPAPSPQPTATPQPTAAPTVQPSPSPPPSPTPTGAAFEPGPCRFGAIPGETVECGDLLVPEDRAQAGGRTIRLAVAIIRSHAANPAPDAFIFLSGGPGVPAVAGAGELARVFKRVLATRDLIVFDQRGVGYSTPSLDCLEWDAALANISMEDLDPEEATAREVEVYQACHDRLVQDGVNLAAYHSAASAADVNDLRLALGYGQVNLYGVSYGSRLALTVLRDFPAGIRSVVLDSVLPPQVDFYADLGSNAQRALDVLFQRCAADAQCGAAFPALETEFYELVDQLSAEPVPFNVPGAAGGEPGQFLLDGDRLITALFNLLYDSSEIFWLPKTIAELAHGYYTGHFYQVLPKVMAMWASAYISDGMNRSVMCAEEVPFHSAEALAAASAGLNPHVAASFERPPASVLAVCDFWGAGEAPAVENEPVASDLPVLILAGEFDPITPPASGQLAAQTLSRSVYYEFPGVGHQVIGARTCAMDIAISFLEAPGSAPDASCMQKLKMGFVVH